MIPPLRSFAPAAKALTGCLVVSLALTLVLGQAMVLRGTRSLDGKPGLSVTDLQLAFTGGYESLLEAQVHGDMRQYAENRNEVATLAAWAREGATREGYLTGASQVLDERCVRCHRTGGRASFRLLDTFDNARAVALTPAAPPLTRQLLVTKIHVFGIGMMLGILGIATLGTTVSPPVKLALVAGGFAGLVFDFSSWWLMRLSLAFAWGRLAGNVLFVCALVAMAAVCISELARSEGRQP